MKKITKAVAIAAIAAIAASATTAHAWWGPVAMTDEQRQAIADQQAQYLEQVQQHQAQAQKAWEEAMKRSAEFHTNAYQPVPAMPAPAIPAFGEIPAFGGIPAIGEYPQDIVALQQEINAHHEAMRKQVPQPWQPMDVSDRFATDPERYFAEVAEQREAALARFEELRNQRPELPVSPRSAERTQAFEQRQQEFLKRRDEAKARRDEMRKVIEEQRAAAWQDGIAARDIVPSEL